MIRKFSAVYSAYTMKASVPWNQLQIAVAISILDYITIRTVNVTSPCPALAAIAKPPLLLWWYISFAWREAVKISWYSKRHVYSSGANETARKKRAWEVNRRGLRVQQERKSTNQWRAAFDWLWMACRFYYVQSVIIRLRSSRSSACSQSSYITPRPAYPVACSSIIPKHHTSCVYSRLLEASENETSEIVYPCHSHTKWPGLSFEIRARIRQWIAGGDTGWNIYNSVARRRNVSHGSCVIIIHSRAPMTRNVNNFYYAWVQSSVCLFFFYFFFFYLDKRLYR